MAELRSDRLVWARRPRLRLGALIGSGGRIGAFVLAAGAVVWAWL